MQWKLKFQKSITQAPAQQQNIERSPSAIEPGRAFVPRRKIVISSRVDLDFNREPVYIFPNNPADASLCFCPVIYTRRVILFPFLSRNAEDEIQFFHPCFMANRDYPQTVYSRKTTALAMKISGPHFFRPMFHLISRRNKSMSSIRGDEHVRHFHFVFRSIDISRKFCGVFFSNLTVPRCYKKRRINAVWEFYVCG